MKNSTPPLLSTPAPLSGYITEKEAAAYLVVAVKTLQNWRGLCKGPAYKKIGRLVRYSTADLAAFAEKNTVQAIQR